MASRNSDIRACYSKHEPLTIANAYSTCCLPKPMFVANQTSDNAFGLALSSRYFTLVLFRRPIQLVAASTRSVVHAAASMNVCREVSISRVLADLLRHHSATPQEGQNDIRLVSCRSTSQRLRPCLCTNETESHDDSIGRVVVWEHT